MNENENLTQEELDYLNSKKGKLLNPRMDSTFKALFTQPTEESRKALHSFLEAVLVRKIVEVKFEPNDAVQQFGDQRDVDYDINVRFTTGESAEIEMQASPQQYDFGKRAEYQCARLLSTYLDKGEKWSNVNKVYQISVLNYGYEPFPIKDDDGKIIEEDKREDLVLSHYTMKNQNGERLTNILNIVFIDLTKLGRVSEYTDEKLEQTSQAEKWALYLKNADKTDRENTSKLIEKLIKTEEGLMNANTVLSSISENRALWLSQYHAEVRERNRISDLDEARRKGFEKGEKQGFEKGEKQGFEKGEKQGRKLERNDLISRLKELSKQGLSTEDILKQLESQ